VLHALDWIALGIITLSALLSLFRGLISELVSLIYWVFAIWLAARLAPALSALFTGASSNQGLRLAMSYALLLVLFAVLGTLAQWLVRKLVHASGLGPTDRLLGAVFGALRGVLMVLSLVLLARVLQFNQDPAWKQARLLPHFERLAMQSAMLLPERVRAALDKPGSPPTQTSTPPSKPTAESQARSSETRSKQ
jgi:membrane protein required for colicin V production